MSLFEDIERTFDGYPDPGESTYSFLNRSAQPRIEHIRLLLDSWFEKVDPASRNELRAAFKQGNEQQHDGAFFELFLHEMLTRLGFSIDIHPNIEGVGSHPDFLARHPREGRFYIEATVTGKRSGPFTRGANEQDVINDLNTLNSPHFHIRVNMEGTLSRTLAKKDVTRPFHELLNAYTAEEVRLMIKAGGRRAAPSRRIECGSWTLEGWLVPISAEGRSVPHCRQLVIGHYRAKRTDSVSRVKNALKKKANRYGKLDAPFIVAVNARDMFYNGEDNDLDVLFGKEQLSYEHPDSPPQLSRMTSGLWSRNSRIDAVMRFQRVDLWNLANADVCLYSNPQKTNLELPRTLFRLSHAKLHGGQMKWFKGEDIAHLVGVNHS